MSSSKNTSQRNERILNELRQREGNEKCADCSAGQPRWASWNLGIWLCVKCATIHRRMGTHISKVKSLSLDIWTKEQVESMRDNGNVKSNALYNPNIRLHPPPLDLESEHAESQLERFIFQKYRDKAFMASSSSSSGSSRDTDTRDTYSASVRPSVSSSSSRRHSPPSLPPVDKWHTRTTTTTTNSSNDAAEDVAKSPTRSSTSSHSKSTPTAAAAHTSRYAATPAPSMPNHHGQQSGVSSAPATNATLSARAMTAPLPDISTTRFSSPSMSTMPPVPNNPFLRHMTASVQIPLTSSNGSPYSNVGYSQQQQQQQQNSFRPSFMPQSYGMSSPSLHIPNNTGQYMSAMPGQTSTLPKGEVWNDLAGLSLSGPSMQMQMQQNQNPMLHHAPFNSASNGMQPTFQASSMSTSNTQFNPYLSSTSMSAYKSPSQTSSFSSGSSFSSLGSLGSSVGISPNTSQSSVYSQQPQQQNLSSSMMPFSISSATSSYRPGQALFQNQAALSTGVNAFAPQQQLQQQQQQQRPASFMSNQYSTNVQPFFNQQQQPMQSYMTNNQFSQNGFNGYA